jgi:glycosyltransferase involved in cell wall biosynthesis
MKVLVSAYYCEPERGSEHGVGWNWVSQISRFHEAWVVTRPCYRGAIREAVAEHPPNNIHWIYFDLPRWTRWWHKGDQTTRFHYYFWQVCAYFMGKRLHQEVGFNLAHHVTTACYWMPSFLALLPIPFVWGPVGGGDSAPDGFWKSFSLYGKTYETFRTLAQCVGRLDPFVRTTARRAQIGLATTPETEVRIRAMGCAKTAILPTIGLPAVDHALLNGMAIRRSNPFRIVSVGNLLHLKGFGFGLQAFAKIQHQCTDIEYWIIGDGPERKRLQRLASDLGVTDKVRFWGAIPRSQVLKKLQECDVLMHPSLHDSGGWVCLEAMAAGRPVVCLDLGGPALQVTEDTGIKVKASTPDEVAADLARAILRLAEDTELRIRMGQASRQRAEEHFGWASKGDFMSGIYESAVGAEAFSRLPGQNAVGQEAD